MEMKTFRTPALRLLACFLCLTLFPLSALAVENDADSLASYVEHAKSMGWIAEGEPDSSEVITRLQFSLMLWRAMGSTPADIANPFSDVAAGTPYAEAAAALYNRSILNGVGDSRFDPDGSLTREMAVTILARAYDLAGDAAANPFADADAVSGWARESVSALAEKGYLEGVGDNQVSPKSALTWGEAAKLLTDLSNGESGKLRFDYTEAIASAGFKSTAYTVPAAADAAIQVSSASNATGVVLTASSQEGNTSDLYLNAYVAGDALTVSGGDITGAVKVYNGVETPLTVNGGSFTFTPEPIAIEDPVDEVIRVTLVGGQTYSLHTVHEKLPIFDITVNNNPDAGVYTAAIDRFLVRLSSDGTVVYYRYMGHKNGTLANFEPHDLAEGRFYTYFLETNNGLRDPGNGYNSGMFVLLDSNYTETSYLTLLPTEKHGEGYLDQHEIVLLSPTHWLLLSYTRERVANIPVSVVDGSKAYVQAGIIQEVKDGKVLMEIDSVDYPELYALSMASNNYAASTLDDPATICDYVHPNSINIDGKDNNLIVSMRNMSSVVKFERQTGKILWILGGPGNQFTGLDSILNDGGLPFLHQHDAKYVDQTVAGSTSTISLFDNETRFDRNATRTLMLELDEAAKTASVVNVINGAGYDEQTGVRHWGTHCGSVTYQTPTSAVIGWGLHVKLDTNAESLGQKALVTEINPQTGELLFEVVPNRNPNNAAERTSFMSYRTYKTAD